ncbi:MAG: chloride channel protein [Owenweeksia sp.]|nr:chloride channel protein [Owenweeksia sp.]
MVILEAIVQGSLFYDYINHGWMILALLLGLVLLKTFATSLTLNAGGMGGVFAPSLFTGATLGYLFSDALNKLPFVQISTSNFALVGMAGLMAGVLHAPLTAVFMIAEVTGGYELILPLMLVSAISFLVARGIRPHSIYTDQLAKRGDLLTHNKDQVILTLLNIDQVMENNFNAIKPEMNLGELVKVVSTSKRNLFPVLEDGNKLAGVLTLDDFRHLMFKQDLYETTFVKELMSPSGNAEQGRQYGPGDEEVSRRPTPGIYP